MKNYVHSGQKVSVVAPKDVASGEVIVIGALRGIACADAAEGEQVSLAMTGVFRLPKGAEALELGELAGWKKGKVVKAAEGVDVIGVVVEAAPQGGGVCLVRF